MRYIITESSIDELVFKIISNKYETIPNETASKIINAYLKKNSDANIVDLIYAKLNSYDLKIIIKDEKYKIFFAYSENDSHAQISYDMSDGWCYISSDFIKKVRDLFGDSEYKLSFQKIISNWVEIKLEGWKVKNYDSENWLTGYRELEM